ncbi:MULTISPECIES: hypothetical protein, partial [unclassified Microcoleus]|uniref:hypothetical protein n=1 Tax=unclassified Microcoleus TaxID=2642155 RepID=UPI002FD512B0
HVLSRPPAFILSQDQTLRVGLFFLARQVLSTQHQGWLFSLDFFLVVCDIKFSSRFYSQS